MTTQSSQPFPRSWNPRSSATRVIPSTVWAAGTTPIDPGDRWPTPVVSRAVTEFSGPGDRVLLLGWPEPTTRSPLTVLPSDTTDALAVVEGVDRAGHIAAGPPGPEHAELILASLLVADLDAVAAADRVVELASAQLAEGGLLVVLSRCGHSETGVLTDPVGAVVTAAQAADLLYLQHIIAAPLHGTTVSTGEPGPGPARHSVAHTDLLVFLRPESAPTQP
ncbi:hypothetical protein [Nocardia wallacei]|uniref:hypothetical protein n=1 Tax=Nocardia wallacei TaxID=480035 RepID=UPI002453EC21|nr:hypothetical protein [Nocardia wallacei]